MSLHLITGYAGQEHITAADHASFNMGVFGKGAFLFDRGNKFKAEIISNNLIRILDGDMMFQGRHVRLQENTYEELMIDNGTQGMKRFDLIVARYTKDVTTGIERCEFAVLKGEENASTAVEPTRADGDISEDGNALITEVPIYRVELDGLNISKLQKKIYVKKLLENPIVPKTKSMRISKTGWFRIAKIECDSLSDARGGIGNNCNIEISRSFNALSTEFKKIQLVSINNSTKFTNEISSAVTNGQLITKIRHTLDTATNTGYVDIYYSKDSSNNMLVTISNHMNYNGQYWELITPEETAETVDGVTVLGSHDFSLNYDVQTRVDRLYDVEEMSYGNKSGTTPTADTEYYSYTALKKCIVNFTFTAFYGATKAKLLTVYRYKNNGTSETVGSSFNGDGGSLSVPVTIILDVGDVIRCYASYLTEGKNTVKVTGYVQYLE